ncbi:MAG: hypothetical protein HYZ72_06905 [Deltaproteobacteria bacterium]|nr:hypothetical protein [Deltaproteobacteria bacterium]
MSKAQTRSREIRARVGHPIIDSDGHTAEFEPALFDYIRDVAGALVDVWQTAPNGLYENQEPHQPDYNLRGRMLTDEQGHYEFQTVVPVSYQIPTDGLVGTLLRTLGRHAWRPAHIHFKVSADGYEPLTTMIFMEGDPYLDRDAVFAVKNSLVVALEKHDSPQEAAKRNVTAPFYTASYEFGLKPVA